MKKLLTLSAGLLSMYLLNTSQAQTTVTFNYTGAVQTWTVPSCVTSINVTANGAKGGNMTYNGQTSNGGNGGRVTCSMPVTPGDVLYIYVGRQGGIPNQNSAGYNGGGAGGNNTFCAGGGGASDIRLNGTALANRVIVAGGGGGAGTNCWGNGDHGGNGGGLTGAPGCQCNSCVGGAPNYPGAGGTQFAGGAAGNDQGQGCTQAGSLGQGGNGACTYGGGGGGGYYGGGGAGYGGGGGGSSFTSPICVGVVHTQGFQNGNGQIVITYTGAVNAGVASASPNPICTGQTTTLTLAGSNGTIQWQISTDGGSTWNNIGGATNSTYTTPALFANTCYRAAVTCGTTAFSNMVCITVNPNNTITLSSAPGTNNQTVCVNTAITNITYTTTGATGATFSGLPTGVTGSFVGGNITISGTPTATGTFNYTVTLTGGCGSVTATGTITVNPNNTITLSSAPGTNNQTVCVNTAITNITYSTTGATGATFSGLPTGVTGSFVGGNITISGTPTATGTFNYTVTLTGGCGSVTATGTITVNPLPTVSVGSNSPVCVGDTILLTSSGGTGYAWIGPNSYSSNVQNPEILNAQTNMSGFYVVTVTDGNACVNSDSTLVTVNPLPSVSANVSPSAVVCAGDTITLTGSGAQSYAWNNGATDGVPFAINNTTVFTVTGTDINGCVNTDSVEVTVHPLPNVSFSMQDTVCINNGTVTLSGGTPNGGTYSGNGVSGNIFDPQVAGIGTHLITYSYTDGNGCSNTASFSVVVDECLGIVSFNPLRSIVIYPNPSRGDIQISLPQGIDQLKAEVYDMQGKVIYSIEQVQVTGGIANLDMQHLSNGLYHVSFSTPTFKHAVKVALQK